MCYLCITQQKLYLIAHGTVASYTDDGEELNHLHDGNIFGEIEFLRCSKILVSWELVQLGKISK